MDAIVDAFAKAGIFLGSPKVYLVISLVGLLTPYRTVFLRCAVLTLFTIIYNVYLKSIWQVPLPAPLEGWAFPSGHMHTAVVFWGWLAFEYKKLWSWTMSFFILCLCGYGLLFNVYHYPIDIVGSVGFGTLSIFLYALLNKTPAFKKQPALNGILLFLVSAVILLKLPTYALKPHLWNAFAGLGVLACAWVIVALNSQRMDLMRSSVAQPTLEE